MPDFYQCIHDYFAAIAALDVDAYAACFTPDCEIHDPVGPQPHQGHEGGKAFLSGFAAITERLNIRAGKIELNGNRAAFSWAAEAVGKNGKFAMADGIDVVEFDDNGKIVRLWGYWNPAPAIATLTQ
jgi:ketosteroid isomerase-like protein